MWIDGRESVNRQSVVDYKETMDKVADCMQLCGMKQADLARELKVSPVSVNQWLHGIGFPCIDDLVKIADVFEMYVDDLIVRK